MADVDRSRNHAGTLFPRAGGLIPPLSVIESWPSPNYVNPETRGWGAPVVLILLTVLTFLVFGARIWSRVFLSKTAGLDDLVISSAMLPLLGVTISTILAIKVYGYQWHVWDQTASSLITSRQIILAIEIQYTIATSLVKISILCFYRRITSRSISKTFVWCVRASIVFVILYAISFTMAILLTCSPIEGYWHFFDIAWRLEHPLKCRNEGAIIVSVCVISTLQDFIVCAQPVFLVWNLQISKRQKMALIGIFGLGLLTCVCGVMRTYYAVYVYYFTFDNTWIAYNGWVWTSLEVDLGVICASVPALKIFFRRYFSQSLNRSKYGYGYGESSGKKISYGRGTRGYSKGASKLDSGRWETTDIPLGRIQVSTRMDVTVNNPDDAASRKSDGSTNMLTALPVPPQAAGSSWLDLEQNRMSMAPDYKQPQVRYVERS